MLETILTCLSLLVSIPLLVVGTECMVAIFFNTRSQPSEDGIDSSKTYKIIIPAHNESQILAGTLTQLIKELPDQNPDNIILVADNCSDATADIARSMGAIVLERDDSNNRGKGFALDFGIQHLDQNSPPDILVIMDADCETTKPALTNLINTVAQSNLPAQMTYLMRVGENASIKQKVSGFAWMLKNKIRLLAVNKLGCPVTLTGTGMAFPWQVFQAVKLGHGNIVEDMQLGIDCAIQGFPPVFCSEALVYSDFPEQISAEISQRTRWEHGHLQTILHEIPKLILESVRRKNWRLFALALDIGVPPLSLQVVLSLGSLIALLGCYLLIGTALPLVILLLSFAYFALMLGGIWFRFGQSYLSANELMAIPNYVLSKLSIYSNFVFKRQKEWVRTKRDP